MSASYSQAQRLLTLDTPLGPDVLLLERLRGVEGVSSLFHFHLDLLAEPQVQVPFDQLLGQPMRLAIRRPNGQERRISGICARLRHAAAPADAKLVRYQAELVPHLWLLSKRVQSRIFQQQSVPQILQIVLKDLKVSYTRLTGTYHPRNYCVQYRESDLAFASRLLEDEGIFYYFEHTADGDELVLVDHQANVPTLAAPDDRLDFTQVDSSLDREAITAWEKSQEMASGGYVVRDRSFEIPASPLEAQASLNGLVAVGAVQHALKLAGNADLTIYEHPGFFANRFDGIDPGGSERPAELHKLFEENQRTVNLRMEEEAARSLRVEGAGRCAGMLPGHRFRLENHAHCQGDYLILRVELEASVAGHRSGEGPAELRYQNRFQCLPARMAYRPPRATPRPRVEGTLTATVSGHQDGEIFTDKYGRVKVLFHWDRQGQNDGNSSCWVRVMQPWAGQGWGAIQLPRVGQEVVVDFLEGNPDRPIILGGVYNAEQMPPYPLPEKREVSGVRSRSHRSADSQQYNEIRMEDTPNQELLNLQAQKDMTVAVENDYSLTVDNNSTVAVKNNAVTSVDHNATTTVGSGPLTMNLLNTWNAIEIDKLTRTTVVGVTHSEAQGIKLEVAPLRFVGVTGAQVHLIVGAAVEKVVGLKYESVSKKVEKVNGAKNVTIAGKFTEMVQGGKTEIIRKTPTDRFSKHTIQNSNFKMETVADYAVDCQVMNLKCAGSGGYDPEFMLTVTDNGANACNINLQTKQIQIGANVTTGDIVIQGKSIKLVAPDNVTIQTKSFVVEDYLAVMEGLAAHMENQGLDSEMVEAFLAGQGLDDLEVAAIIARVFPG